MKTKAGFSLIEILIVIAIMAIMTGAVFANKNNDTSPKDVDAAVQQVVAQLRALQNDALNGKQIGTTTVRSFIFDSSATTSYTVSYKDQNGTSVGSAVTTKLKPTVKISAATATFTSPFGAGGSQTIKISSVKNSSVSKNICIESGGNIEALTTACPN